MSTGLDSRPGSALTPETGECGPSPLPPYREKAAVADICKGFCSPDLRTGHVLTSRAPLQAAVPRAKCCPGGWLLG